MPKRVQHKLDENGFEMKFCGKHKAFTSLSEFHKSKSTWDSLQPICKHCIRTDLKRRRFFLDVANQI